MERQWNYLGHGHGPGNDRGFERSGEDGCSRFGSRGGKDYQRERSWCFHEMAAAILAGMAIVVLPFYRWATVLFQLYRERDKARRQPDTSLEDLPE